MALAALPVTSGALKFTKWVVRAAAEGLALYEAYLQFGQTTGDVAAVEWRRMHAVFTRATPAGTTEDAALCTFDFVNITSGTIDTTWTTTDYTNIETALSTMFTTLAPGQSPKLTLSSYRWYRKQFAPPGSSYPSGAPRYFVDSGPPLRITPKSIVGTGSGTQQVPFQVALSVTEKTPLPKHWGRWYYPSPGMSMFDAFGRIANPAFVSAPAATAYGACADAELFPVVPVGKSQALLGVTQIQVDDIPDVQRSRRAKTTLVRSVGP